MQGVEDEVARLESTNKGRKARDADGSADTSCRGGTATGMHTVFEDVLTGGRSYHKVPSQGKSEQHGSLAGTTQRRGGRQKAEAGGPPTEPVVEEGANLAVASHTTADCHGKCLNKRMADALGIGAHRLPVQCLFSNAVEGHQHQGSEVEQKELHHRTGRRRMENEERCFCCRHVSSHKESLLGRQERRRGMK